MSTIATGDVSNEFDGSAGNGEADFLAHFLPDGDGEDASKKKPSEKGAEDEVDETSQKPATDENESTDEGSDESPEAEEGEESSDTEGDEETEQKAKKFVEIDDNTFVKVKVGDEEIEVPVKDLTRVHGQEAALTRKSQEVAELRKKANDEAAKSVATLDVMLKRARERAAPFAQIDFLALTKDPNISAEDLSNLRATAQAAFDDVRFLEQEQGNFMQAIQAKLKTERDVAAKACIEALTTPGTDDKPNKHFIEGWNDKVYDEIRSFAVSTGLDQETVNGLTDPAAFKLIHMAMMYQRGASKVVETKKVNKTPKKIVKTTNSPAANRQAPEKAKAAKTMEHLKRHQTVDAAGDAFLARFNQQVDDE